MLIVGHATVEYNDDIYVTAAGCPEAIHAGASGRYRDLALQKVALSSTISIVERVLDPLDNLVARLQTTPLDALLFIDNSHNLLSAFQVASPQARS